MLYRLDALHAALRARPSLQRFTLLNRTLLAIGFIAPGFSKALGIEFAPNLDPATAAGAYFEVFHATGAYYAFVGLVQGLAGALLLWRRTALLGALLYLPVIANIAVLTATIGFGTGTPRVTALMLLACVWLVLWDAHRLVAVVALSFRPVRGRAVEPEVWDLFVPVHESSRTRWVLRAGYVVGLVGVLVLLGASRGLAPWGAIQGALLTVAAGAIVTLLGWTLGLVRWGRGRLGPQSAGPTA